MASQMVIPASNDTLFIRGFSSRHHIDEIRDFFSHEGGRNTVEFFKESATGDQLFIALKFESKSIAKDVLNRFDGYEVMGDRISLSWYKDIRKARGFDGGNYRRGGGGQQWPADRYDYRQGGGNYSRGGRDNRTGSYRGGNQRAGGWYPRGSDYSEGGSRSRRYTRSSSRSQSRSPSARSRSHSASRSSSRDDRGSRSHSDDSRERTRKRRRSASDASNHGRRSGRTKTGTKGRGGSSSSASPDPDASHSESDSLPPPSSDNKKTKNRVKKSSASGSLDRRTPSASRDIKTKELNVSGGGMTGDGELEGSDGQELIGDDMSSPPQPVPPPGGAATAAASKASRAALRSAVTTVPGGKKSKAAAAAAAAAAALDDSAVEAANMPPADSSSLPPSAGRKPPGESSVSGPPGAAAGTKTKKKDRRAPADEITDDDIFAAQTRKQPRNETDEFLQQYERQKHDNDPTGDYMYDDNGPAAPVGAPGKRKVAATGKKMKPVAGEFDPFDEDEDAMMAELGGKRRRPDEPGRGAGRGGAGGKRMAPGAVGLSYEKMQMVRQKKEEIEKAYRQDCETFATVTKMLISKEPSLEEKIQNSLRENLKDIGHRCIQELRDFIERLKDEDLDDV